MILKRITDLLAARASLVYLVSEEEERVERLVATAAEKVFSELMGDNVEQRRRFIEENAINVKNLDV